MQVGYESIGTEKYCGGIPNECLLVVQYGKEKEFR